MIEVPISEFKAKCLALLEEVRKNTKTDTNYADMASLWQRLCRLYQKAIVSKMIGSMEGSIIFKGDIISPAK